jgi:hypothetical protein
MPILIWLAILIEVGIENWIDAGILLGIQFANATLGWYETIKAADAVAALKASLKPLATVKRDGQWQNIDATTVVPGDLVLLGSGSAVPADCIVRMSKGGLHTQHACPIVMRTRHVWVFSCATLLSETSCTHFHLCGPRCRSTRVASRLTRVRSLESPSLSPCTRATPPRWGPQSLAERWVQSTN